MVYFPSNEYPFYKEIPVEFEWVSGLNLKRKQMNITKLHDKVQSVFPNIKLLEISSKSMQSLGVKLAALNLKMYLPPIEKRVSVENIYQGSKVFFDCEDLTDLYNVEPIKAKKDPRITSHKCPDHYSFNGTRYNVDSHGSFYNTIYLQALEQNRGLANSLLQYDSFTDIELNPEKSNCCQAKAAAIYVGRHKICNNYEIVNNINLDIYKLQKDFKAGFVRESDISVEALEKLVDLYKKQISQTKKQLEKERFKLSILKQQ